MMDSFLQKFIPPDLITKFKAEYEKWIKSWNGKIQVDSDEHKEILTVVSSVRDAVEKIEQRIKNLEEKL